MKVNIEQGWKKALQEEFDKPYFSRLTEFVRHAYRTQNVHPPAKQLFACFDLCPFDKTSVVILGQDPYHGKGQAHGLCFSVPKNCPRPPSLENIFEELYQDTHIRLSSGDLTHWAKQGVLLLNAVLSVQDRCPGSHANKGWEVFTDAAIQQLSQQKKYLVFLLWGNFAQRKIPYIDSEKHCILTAAHPSPFSANKGFFHAKHFSQTNQYLESKNMPTIQWG